VCSSDLMDFMSRMTAVVDYIEQHISEDMDVNDIAKIVCCGVYQFGRIWSYVVGVSLSEYIRRRRLSLAAIELQGGDVKVIDVAMKYGYDSPDAFARAFGNLHGITPREACAPGARLRLYPRLSFYITIKGGEEMEYRIVEKPEVTVVGVVKNFGKWTANKEGKNWQERSGEVWKYWDEYLDGGMDAKIASYKLYRPPFYQVEVTQTLANGETILGIGAESDGKSYPDLATIKVPASTWAVFTARGTLHQDTHPIEALMTRILAEWFPSSGYVKSMNYELEVYGPGNTQSDDYTCEMWIPVKRQ
jgi:AraC family transcriptional regulator